MKESTSTWAGRSMGGDEKRTDDELQKGAQ